MHPSRTVVTEFTYRHHTPPKKIQIYNDHHSHYNVPHIYTYLQAYKFIIHRAIASKFLPALEHMTSNQREKSQEINSTAPAPTIFYSKLVLPPPKK
jgi:hypothetical protein